MCHDQLSSVRGMGFGVCCGCGRRVARSSAAHAYLHDDWRVHVRQEIVAADREVPLAAPYDAVAVVVVQQQRRVVVVVAHRHVVVFERVPILFVARQIDIRDHCPGGIVLVAHHAPVGADELHEVANRKERQSTKA